MKECPPNPLSLSDISETSQTSYRSISHPESRAPPLSAPFGFILSEVRAPPPSRRPQVIYPLPNGSHGGEKGRSFSRVRRQPPVAGATRGNTMSRGGRSARMDPLAWWSSVKVRDKREGSSEPGSGIESGDGSRVHSTSRRNSRSSHRKHSGFFGQKNETFVVESEDEPKENEFGQSLQDESVHFFPCCPDADLPQDYRGYVETFSVQGQVGEGAAFDPLASGTRSYPGHSTISPKNAPSPWASLGPGVNLRQFLSA